MAINKIRKDGVDYDIMSNEIYSTEEQIIGTWTDGKPIYRKVVIGSGTIQGDTTIPHGINNLEYVIKFDMQLRLDGASFSKWHMLEGDICVDSTNIIVNGNAETTITGNFDSSVFILEYTKTTD